MSLDGQERPRVDEVMCGLKDFQRDTVEYAFRRLYLDPEPASRFLIADEVGLGKTLVARGLIAKAVDHLWDSVERIDVLYICSNQEIARQNIDRLNITSERHFQLASRATLLPVTLQQLKGNKLNFVSFTPGTSFKLHSSSGVAKERWVLYRLLMKHWKLHEPTCRNVLRAWMARDSFKRHIASYDQNEEIDRDLAKAFYRELDANRDLKAEYKRIAKQIGYKRKHIPETMRAERDIWIGKMRRLLARSSLSALEPDIVILDEFQRFKYLLDEDDPVALLARQVLDFPKVKVLLLSATPYKMYSLAWELKDDHYQDFYRTAQFLLRGDNGALTELQEGVAGFRNAYLQAGAGASHGMDRAKSQIEGILRKIMVRTERLASSADRNGMLREEPLGQDSLAARDFRAFRHFDRIAQQIDAGDQVEFWKSTSYPLNLMEGYKVKQLLKSALEDGDRASLEPLLTEARDHLLSWKDLQRYARIDPENARLRGLLSESVETGNCRLLWVPASLPYYRNGRAFKDVAESGLTKSLVFSAWRVVPKAIAVLASYEAERQILKADAGDFHYEDLTRKRRPLLNFARSKGRLVGMPVFCLTYPSWTLAKAVDPLQIGLELAHGSIASERAVFHRAREVVDDLLKEAVGDWPTEKTSRVDDRWYWAALALLDWHQHRQLLEAWFGATEEGLQWEHMLDEEAREDRETRFVEHVREFQGFLRERVRLGRPPADLLDVLARVAIAGPATASLRAMLRIATPESDDDSAAFLAGAARAGLGFRALFNQPLAISTVNQVFKSGAYWAKVLKYAQVGNLQAVMDEYVHVLNESLGLMGHAAAERAEKIAEAIATAASLRTPSLGFDEIARDDKGSYTLKLRRIRCRYALRFGDEKSEGVEEVTRSADVRLAFNSPFRPFILATTSIGQEGLDFHQYCHRVVHWNLPSNPVDLEQREGRVHRYKGHVIRRNLAKRYGLSAVPRTSNGLIDPWEHLFERACRERSDDANDLEPYWVFDTKDGYKIERQVPLLPLSREIGQLAWLKKTLVAYRSVIGQPRQEELIEFLLSRLGPEELAAFAESCSIDLSPPTLHSTLGRKSPA